MAVIRMQKIPIDLPRQLEDVTVAKTAREILDDLREEINRSIEFEYGCGGRP